MIKEFWKLKYIQQNLGIIIIITIIINEQGGLHLSEDIWKAITLGLSHHPKLHSRQPPG